MWETGRGRRGRRDLIERFKKSLIEFDIKDSGRTSSGTSSYSTTTNPLKNQV